MTKFQHKIAFIVPTRNRPDLLAKLLQTLQNQTVQADQVIVVDGSDRPIEQEIKQFLSQGVSYLRVYPPSLTKQRNEGIKVLADDITLAGYLDDDLVLEKDAVEAMLGFWEHCSENVGGCSFNITNMPNKPPNKPAQFIFDKLFCTGGKPGQVLRSGINIMAMPVSEDTYTEWLSGGATVWRRQILEDFKFDEWLWTYSEDVDFSLVVGRKYKLVVLHDARVQHFPPPYNPKKCYSLGKLYVQQRYYLVRKHPQLSIPLFFWAKLGEIPANFFSGVLRRNRCKILHALGSIAGLFNVIRGKHVQTNVEFRK